MRVFKFAGLSMSTGFPEKIERWKAMQRIARSMLVESGRVVKRVQLSVPVVICSPEDPSTVERTTTENVCSMGVRVVTEHNRELNEKLMICSIAGDERMLARVVYCQRLPDGRFSVGLEFETVLSQEPRWSEGSVL
jgi:hypothetical protein